MLHLLVIINRKSKMIGLNISWPVEYIDNISGTIKPRFRKDPDFSDCMLIISNELSKINEVFKLYRIQDKLLTMELFNRELSNMDMRKDFLSYMNLAIKERFDRGEIELRTKMNHTTTYNRLCEWVKKVPFYTLDSGFLLAFERHLRKKPIGNNDNTIWTRIKDVVTYLKRAQDEGIAINVDYKKYCNREGGSSLVYLETFEINQLVKLHNANKLDSMRQVVLKAFLFSCFTSLRISDVQRANWKWVNINSEMKFIPHKTRRFKRYVNVPLSPVAKMFIENNGGKFFNLPSDVEFNRSLKDIGIAANLTTVLTSKISRHSFGTHYYRYTKDLVSLQRIMGHQKVETTMIYVHANDIDSRIGMKTLSESFTSPEFDKLFQPKSNVLTIKSIYD